MNTTTLTVAQRHSLLTIEKKFAGNLHIDRYLRELAETIPNNYELGAYIRYRNKEVEKCIKCKVPTPYTTDQDITNREYYVEGAGQLCHICYYELTH